MACQFCGNPQSHSLRQFNIDADVCLSCLEQAKLCDSCGTLHIYNKTITYVEGPNQYLCRTCAGDMANCTRCGKLTSANSKVGTKCVCKKCIDTDYFRCDCCKKLRLNTGCISNLEYHQYSDVLDGPKTCRMCFKERTKDATPKVVHECSHCKEITSQLYSVGGNQVPFCPKCAKNLYPCGHCREQFFYDQTYPLPSYNGSSLCPTCTTADFSRCSICGEYHLVSEGVAFKLRVICQKCAKKSFTCPHCEDVFLEDGNSVKIEGKKHCYKCAKLYLPCGKCGKSSFDVEEYQNKGGGLACPTCRMKEGLYMIKRYNYVPRRLEMTGKGPLFFGLENELSVGSEGNSAGVAGLCTYIAKLGNPRMFIKHDGSVENGVEVVTHPADFASIKTLGFDKMFTKKVVPHKSCGFHVHLSRAAFDSVHLFKFVKFFNLFQKEVEKLAGRTYEMTYQNGRTVKKTEEHEISDLIQGKIKDKYREIRLNCENTIEVRIFKGATTPEEMWLYVEFCDAVYHYTKQHELIGQTWSSFRSFIDSHGGNYPNLTNYLHSN